MQVRRKCSWYKIYKMLKISQETTFQNFGQSYNRKLKVQKHFTKLRIIKRLTNCEKHILNYILANNQGLQIVLKFYAQILENSWNIALKFYNRNQYVTH